MCAANHVMQLYDRMAEDTRVSKGIVELICANLVCTLLCLFLFFFVSMLMHTRL